ncbi:MAG: DUF1036 domain-containing protein [Oceanicaulis sp.]|nr:DUF1036 domain-containing protein [Oceanicaulis sp.]
MMIPALLAAALSSAAYSEIEVCNERAEAHRVAVSGVIDGQRFTEGWLHVAPGVCVSLGVVQGPEAYLFAASGAVMAGGRFQGWATPAPEAGGGHAPICVSPGENFSYEGARTECGRGEAAGYFQRIALEGDHTLWRIR